MTPASEPGPIAIQSESQDEIVAFLADPASHGLQEGIVERVETHGAFVFLAGNDAFKIKRAVRYPYLDFSTLDKRRRACEREVEVNRPHAPQIYLGLVPIVRRADGTLGFGGSGTAVEWAVRMRRFNEADVLSRIADRGPIGSELAVALADAVAGYHRRLPPSSGAGALDALGVVVEGIAAALAEARPALAPQELVEGWRRTAAERLAAARGCLTRRAAQGLVRRCHGDLHLNNIVL